MSEDKKTPIIRDRYLLTALVKTEADFDELVRLVKETGVTIEKTENMGVRTLAFPINKQHELLLTSIFIRSNGATINQLEKDLRHEEVIQRFLLTDWKGDLEAPKRNHPRYVKRADKPEGIPAHV